MQLYKNRDDWFYSSSTATIHTGHNVLGHLVFERVHCHWIYVAVLLLRYLGSLGLGAVALALDIVFIDSPVRPRPHVHIREFTKPGRQRQPERHLKLRRANIVPVSYL